MAEKTSIHDSSPIATISRIRVHLAPETQKQFKNDFEMGCEYSQLHLSIRCLTLDVIPKLAAV